MHTPGRHVADRHREHALQPSQRAKTAREVCGQNHLGVGLGGEGEVRQLGAHVGVVVDLAVEHEGDPPLGVPHRLMRALGEVDNGKSDVQQIDLPRRFGGCAPEPLAVGTAAREPRHARFERSRRSDTRGDDPADEPAHACPLPVGR